MSSNSPSWIAALAAALIASACSVPPQVQRPDPVAISNALAETNSTVRFQHPARFTKALPGTLNTVFTSGLYVQSDSHVFLLSYWKESETFVKVFSIPMKDIDYFAVESTGMFNHLQQVQIFSHGFIYVALLSNTPDAQAGSKEVTSAAVDSLLKAGVKQGQPHTRISPPFNGGVFIPIPVKK